MYWGRHFWAREYFCVTSGDLTEERVTEYLGYHFEPTGDDDFRTKGCGANPPALVGDC